MPRPRDFVPWCISDAGLYGAGMGSSLPASEMLHTTGLMHCNIIGEAERFLRTLLIFEREQKDCPSAASPDQWFE